MSGNKYFDEAPGLKWNKSLGMGYLPLEETPYDKAYFEKYVGYENTEIGLALNKARIDLVNKYCPEGSLVDVGIGSGQFMNEIGCFGFDVNPTALEILHEKALYLDPHFDFVDCATFWDSMEHIKEISEILFRIKRFAFVSIPIFKGVTHVLHSKHFRPDEHCWYFTDAGFKKFMYAHGFIVKEQNTIESDLGREDIGTYVCERVNVTEE